MGIKSFSANALSPQIGVGNSLLCSAHVYVSVYEPLPFVFFVAIPPTICMFQCFIRIRCVNKSVS